MPFDLDPINPSNLNNYLLSQLKGIIDKDTNIPKAKRQECDAEIDDEIAHNEATRY